MYSQEMLDDQYSESLLAKLQKYGLGNNETIINAMRFAKFYHKGQHRKSGEPYYMHPVAVTEMALPYTKSPDIIASALMHDVVEDTIATIEMIQKDFGPRIAEMVDRLTRDRPDGSKLSVEEIINNAYRFKDKDVLLIKIIDRLHNLQNMNSITTNKQIAKARETLNTILIACTYLENINTEFMIGVLINKILSYKAEDDLLKQEEANDLLDFSNRDHFIDLFQS